MLPNSNAITHACASCLDPLGVEWPLLYLDLSRNLGLEHLERDGLEGDLGEARRAPVVHPGGQGGRQGRRRRRGGSRGAPVHLNFSISI